MYFVLQCNQANQQNIIDTGSSFQIKDIYVNSLLPFANYLLFTTNACESY